MNIILRTDNARDRMKAAWDAACRILELGKAVRLRIEECQPTRTLEQNDCFHGICTELSTKRQWAGRHVDTEGWKRLLVDAWARATERTQGVVVPSLDGHSVVNLGIQTRRMKVGEMSDLIEFAHAWCAQNDVELSQ